MSAVDAQATIETPARSRLGAALEEHGALVVVVGAATLVLLVALRHALVVDGWLALVSGRAVAHGGLPSHDTLTQWTAGDRWTDQQWLAQLAFYGMYRIGGFALLLLMHAALAAAAVAIAALLSLRIGATARSTAWVCIAVVVAYYPLASVARPQSFAYPLFAATMWLAFTDARAQSRRIWAALPLLVLWANMHGSVVLGAVLVSLAAIGRLRTRRSASSAALLVLPWACVFASPYAFALPSYYRTILVGGDFKHFVTEWAPTTLTPSTAVVYVLAIGGAWLLGRAGSRLTATEKLAFLFTCVLAFEAVRNTGWLGLTSLALLPTLVDSVRRPAVEPRRLNRLLAISIAFGIVVAVAGIAVKPSTWFTAGFPARAAAAAATSAGAHGSVYASSGYADWLLWRQPQLAGRVAYDARFELLSHEQLVTIAGAQAASGNWRATLGRYGTFVLDRRHEGGLADALRRSMQAQVVFADGDVVVLSRDARR
jgi:hypothetical protein